MTAYIYIYACTSRMHVCWFASAFICKVKRKNIVHVYGDIVQALMCKDENHAYGGLELVKIYMCRDENHAYGVL